MDSGNQPPKEWPLYTYKHPDTGAVVNCKASDPVTAIHALVQMAAGLCREIPGKPVKDKPRIIPFIPIPRGEG